MRPGRRHGAEQLYDLETDPKERNPLDLGLPEVQEPLARLRSIIARFR